MKWRIFAFICLLAAVLLPAVLLEAQQPAKVPRIGYLSGGPAVSAGRDAFRHGLRELGYVEGKSIVIEWRLWETEQDRQRAFAADLARLKVDVIVAVGSGDIRIAKEAVTTIPIVMINPGDAIASGFIASLARPGGTITGLASLRPELSGKRMELLKEIVPKLSRVAVFASPNSRDYAQVLKEIELAAGAFGVKIQSLNILSSGDFQIAFRTAAKERAEAALFRVPGPILSPHRTELARLAVKNRLPAIFERAEEVEAGGLMSYGLSDTDRYRRAATYVDKILKGAKPADLPVEQPTKFEFVVNLKTAKEIRLTIPQSVLYRADRVIR